MGKLATVKSFESAGKDGPDVKADLGGGRTVSAAHMDTPGVDAAPLPGDLVQLEDSTGTGAYSATGYSDPKNERKAANGERRTYARTPDGTVAAEIWAKANGDVKITSLFAGGKIILNGVEIDQQGNITTPGDVTAMAATPATAITLSEHVHPTGMGPSGPPTPGS